ncbi:MAG: ThiF family adenylyltransferase [Campylobacterales bacterium]
MDQLDRYTRPRWIFGEDFKKLERAKVILFGAGGVGGHCLDALWRSGVTDITVVDGDRFDVTNQNRQINSDRVGEYKAEVAAERFEGVTGIVRRVDKAWIDGFDFAPYDLVLDAIDDIGAKVALARHTHRKLISSMGGARRLDPTRIKVSKIWQVEHDPFASRVKRRLRYEGLRFNYTVIYSEEPPVRCHENALGSFIGVTGAFGLAMAAEAIKRLRHRMSHE